MTQLIRNIEDQDIPKIKDLLQIVFSDNEYRTLSRLGGMTNHSYKVTREDEQEYLVRIPGEGTEELINRNDERISTNLACRLGIDSELLYFGDDGSKVMRFISNPQPMSNRLLQEHDIIEQAAGIFRKLHTCDENTGVRFEVFEMADLYEKIIYENHVVLYEDYPGIKQTVMDIKAAIDSAAPAQRVPCHNDSLVDNWVLDDNRKLYLIDWEYSGMNEAMWDLSCLSIEADFTDKHDEELLNAYYGHKASPNEQTRFSATKLYVDYLWTLWGLTRVPYDGTFMQNYADMRYHRLKQNIEKYFNK